MRRLIPSRRTIAGLMGWIAGRFKRRDVRPAHCRAAGPGEDTVFATRPELAGMMIERPRRHQERSRTSHYR